MDKVHGEKSRRREIQRSESKEKDDVKGKEVQGEKGRREGEGGGEEKQEGKKEE